MQVVNNVLELIGNTPILKLNKFNPELKFNLYAKCEMFNPTLSIKDRIVFAMIKDAEDKGQLKPGGIIFEASSGNTGSSLSMVASVLGYKTIITVPAKTSQEKINTMRVFGAEVIICESAPVDSPLHYNNKARLLSEQTPNSVYLGQYDNIINVQAHYESTAKEIWQQMEGNIDYFIAAASTGGTITGVAKFLKEKNPNINITLADPCGSVLYHSYYHQSVNYVPYKVEGAGKDRVCAIQDFSVVDNAIQFTDEEAFTAARKLAKTEGILAGGSSGGILATAEKLNQHIKTDTSNSKLNVVVILPDSGFKYLTAFYKSAE